MINDSMIMLNEAAETYPTNTSQMHLYAEDVASTHATALANGATEIIPVNTRPHGDQMAGFTDPNGNAWWVASRS